MSVMDQSLSELQAVVDGQLPGTVGGAPVHTTEDHEAQAKAEVDALGAEPTFKQVAALMVYNIKKVEGEAKQSRAVITHHLMETIKTVGKHDGEIVELKGTLQKASDAFGGLKASHENLSSKMLWMEEKVTKSYEIACESKQRSAKGNFILTGEHIPNYTPNENLFHITAYSLYQKYGISLAYHDLKALHRFDSKGLGLIGNSDQKLGEL